MFMEGVPFFLFAGLLFETFNHVYGYCGLVLEGVYVFSLPAFPPPPSLYYHLSVLFSSSHIFLLMIYWNPPLRQGNFHYFLFSSGIPLCSIINRMYVDIYIYNFIV